MLKLILVVIVLAVVSILGLAMTKPDTFHVERSVTINAPADKIYPLIADFHGWEKWSPWEHLDPAMKKTYGGAASGKGATYAWEGNKDVGKGMMEITDATAPTAIAIKLDFIEPFEGHSVTKFALAQSGASTKVTWTIDGPMNFLSKVMCVFKSMDAMMGKDFESGLASLSTAAAK